ncbi:MAG TPA: TIGR02186 family protein, partial [Roseomonas sp.]
MLALLLLLAPELAVAQVPDTARPTLAVGISTRLVEVTTGFTGASILVFGAAERPLGGETGDAVLVTVRGPRQPLEVRRKVEVLGIWINGPAARFRDIPGFYAIAGTRP